MNCISIAHSDAAKTKKPDKLLLKTKEACLFLGINRNLLDSFRRAGIIKASKLSRQYYFSINELYRFSEWISGKEVTKEGLVIGDI